MNTLTTEQTPTVLEKLSTPVTDTGEVHDLAKTLFTPEHLATLDIPGYVELMNRFPEQRDVVTHVIRQGVRDHNTGNNHNVGMGQFHHGFKQVLESGRLRSFVDMAEEELFFKEEGSGSGRWMTKWVADDAQEYGYDSGRVYDEVHRLTFRPGASRNSTPHYVDKKAVHFCVNEVGNQSYGAERDNEIFFVFPALFVASQYHFQGLTQAVEDNDNWVWPSRSGIPINSGIAFLPAEAQVDPTTGSQYELDAEGQAIPNTEFAELAYKLVTSDEYETFAEQAKKVDPYEIVMAEAIEEFEQAGQSLPGSELQDPLRQELEKTFGINDQRFQDVLLRTYSLNHFDRALNDKFSTIPQSDRVKKAVADILLDFKLEYKRATHTVRSQDYWETYFEDHPKLKPKRVVFYTGKPTKALAEWCIDQGIADRYTVNSNPFGTAGTDYSEIFPENGSAAHKPEVRKGQEFFFVIVLDAIEKELERRAKSSPEIVSTKE